MLNVNNVIYNNKFRIPTTFNSISGPFHIDIKEVESF